MGPGPGVSAARGRGGTDMTSNKARLLRSLQLYASMVRYGFAHNRDFAKEHWQFFETMEKRLAEYVEDLEGVRVLDVGCGKMMWLTVLLHSAGARVTGIDTEWTEPKPSFGKYRDIWKRNGLERAARTFAWDVLYARSYYRALERHASFPLRFGSVDAREMSAQALDFEDDTFDLVVSHEVFEHLPDVEAAVRELRRVMKPGGVTYIYTHNFTSISGGHHIAWKYPDSEPSSTVPPWDHLRESRFPDIPSWINRWREHQYREVFERHFIVEEWIHTEREAEGLLTEKIRRELEEYSDEELLTKGFITIARPRPGPAGVDKE